LLNAHKSRQNNKIRATQRVPFAGHRNRLNESGVFCCDVNVSSQPNQVIGREKETARPKKALKTKAARPVSSRRMAEATRR
jgi:hypothetical protein